MTILFLTALFVFFVVVFSLLDFKFGFLFFKPKKSAKPHCKVSAESPENQPSAAKCPVCTKPLLRGERLSAVVYLGREKDKSCTILGCPRCYPNCTEGAVRVCPVCKASLSDKDYLISRIRDKGDSKRDVTVIGCSVCRLESDPSRRRLGNFPTAKQIDWLKSQK